MPFTTLREWDFTPVYKKLSKAFSPDQCQEIIALHKDREPMVSEMMVEDKSIRSTDLYWLLPQAGVTDWIFEDLSEVVGDFNDKTFQFELDGCMDLQLTHYKTGQHYGWHADLSGRFSSRRKLSMSVLLSKPNEFSGGDIQFFEDDDHKPKIPLAQGDAVIFPSWYKHRVTEVTHGERWSLVSWWTGPPFR